MLKIMGLMQLQGQAPTLYDPIKIHTAALAAMGWSNPEEFFVPPQARAQPPPQLLEMQQQMENEKKAADAKTAEAQARTTEANARAAEAKAKIDTGHFAPKPEGGVAAGGEPAESMLDIATAQAKILDAHTREREAAIRARTAAVEDQNRDQDRRAKQQDTAIDLAKAVIGAPSAGESGKQVGVAGVGKKTLGIIKDVDKGIGT
jgi:hypothetical protein